MIVGKSYTAFRPSETIELEEEVLQFEEERFIVTLLDKPEKVMVDDGEECFIEKTPDHLMKPEWVLVKNINKGITHWLSLDVYQLIDENAVDYVLQY